MKRSILSIVLACMFFTVQAEEMWHIVGTNDYARTGCLRTIQVYTDSMTGAALYFHNLPQDPGADDLAALYHAVFDRLVQTGSMMPVGSSDIWNIDEGLSGFYRSLWYLNEVPADGGWYVWNDAGISDLQECNWQEGNTMVSNAYMRLLYNMNLQNLYLQTAGRLNLYPEEQKQVRFIRALTAWYMLDLFPSSHFTTETYINGSITMSRGQLYSWLEAELLELSTSLPQTRTDLYHVDADAAKMLLARLYLNAEVYTGTAQWANAALYAQQVMNGEHPLHTTANSSYSPYQELFMGDNDANGAQEEALLMLKQDANTAYSYSGANFLIASTRDPGIGMPAYGISDGWITWRSGYRLMQVFASDEQISSAKGTEYTMPAILGDDRAMFYADDSYPVPSIANEYNGYFIRTWSVNKFTGRYSVDPLDGSSVSASSPTWADMDIPMMRSAEAWLTYAEAQFRLGNTAEARNVIAQLRSRANASTPTTISEDYILDEWLREFYNEGRRRVDLVRFGQFAGVFAMRTWEGHTARKAASYNTFLMPDLVEAFPSQENKYRYFAVLEPTNSPFDPAHGTPCDSCNTGEVYYDAETSTVYSINSSSYGVGGGGAFRSSYPILKDDTLRLELTEFPYMQPVDQPETLPSVTPINDAFVIMLHTPYNYGPNLVVLGDYLNSAGEWIYSSTMRKPYAQTTSGTSTSHQHFARFDSIGDGWYKAVVYPIVDKDNSSMATLPGYACITGVAYYPQGSVGAPQSIMGVHKLSGAVNSYMENSNGEFEFSFSQLAYYDDPTYGRICCSQMATDRVAYFSVEGYDPEPLPDVPAVNPTLGAVTLMIKFDVEPCEGNDIRFVGDYGNLNSTWSFADAQVMTPVGDGWYKIVLFPNNDGTITGRPIQCDENGVGYWNQDWAHSRQSIVALLGLEDRMVVNSGYNEFNLYFTSADADAASVVYLESKDWNFVCSGPQEYTITVTLPEFCESFNVEIVGSFDDWGNEPVAMTRVEGNTYTATVTARLGMEWKIRGEGGWDKELMYYDWDRDSWYTSGNLTFGDDTAIVLYFGNPDYYKWNICD